VQRAADLMEDYALTPEDLETATVVSKFKVHRRGTPPCLGLPLPRNCVRQLAVTRSAVELAEMGLTLGAGLCY